MKGRQFLSRFTFFERVIPYAPLVSAIVIFALGIGLTYTALGRYQPPSQTSSPAQAVPAPSEFVLDEAQVIFMDYDEERKNQLYQGAPVEPLVQPITDEPGGVVDFAVDNRRGVVYYSNFD